MAQAREILSESGTIMILTDPRGVILQTEGDPATVDAARRIRLQTGASWHEPACGTNAIGTALAVGGPVQVHAAEHFCAGIKPWTCSATVVRDPATATSSRYWMSRAAGCVQPPRARARGGRGRAHRRAAAGAGADMAAPLARGGTWAADADCAERRARV